MAFLLSNGIIQGGKQRHSPSIQEPVMLCLLGPHIHSKNKEYFQTPFLVLQFVTNRELVSVPGRTTIGKKEMIRLGVCHTPYSFRDVQGLLLASAQNTKYKAISGFVPYAINRLLSFSR